MNSSREAEKKVLQDPNITLQHPELLSSLQFLSKESWFPRAKKNNSPCWWVILKIMSEIWTEPFWNCLKRGLGNQLENDISWWQFLKFDEFCEKMDLNFLKRAENSSREPKFRDWVILEPKFWDWVILDSSKNDSVSKFSGILRILRLRIWRI